MSEIEIKNEEIQVDDRLATNIINRYSSNLFKEIKDITISDIRLKSAFDLFLKEIECGDTIKISDVLFASESVLKGGKVKEKANNEIYCVKNIPLNGFAAYYNVLKNSVGSLSGLINLNSGAIIDLNAVGDNIDIAETKRYIILPEKKMNKLISVFSLEKIEIKKVGRLIAENKIYLARGESIVGVIDKSRNDELSKSILLNNECFNDFLSGYNSVISLFLSNCISTQNYLRFGVEGELSSVFARALGCYCAAVVYKFMPIRMIFNNNDFVDVSVNRPRIDSGDSFYYLKIRSDKNGMPDRIHTAQLVQYLRDNKKADIIKDVLPLRENIQSIISSLGTEKVSYKSINEIPKDSFGLIVSVKQGSALNGIKLGEFIDN